MKAEGEQQPLTHEKESHDKKVRSLAKKTFGSCGCRRGQWECS